MNCVIFGIETIFVNLIQSEFKEWKTCVKNIGGNGFGLGEGGLVGCSILAGCFCPLLPNPVLCVVAVI